jgi:hypothetical protein
MDAPLGKSSTALTAFFKIAQKNSWMWRSAVDHLPHVPWGHLRKVTVGKLYIGLFLQKLINGKYLYLLVNFPLA